MHIYYSPACLEYGEPGHPESPDRIRSTAEHLQKSGYDLRAPGPCEDEDILRVHTKMHMEKLKQGAFFDNDTPAYPKIDTYARLSAGAAIQAAESAKQGVTGFSLMRPPGHHATPNRVMGFCYLNNIAIAAAKYLAVARETRAPGEPPDVGGADDKRRAKAARESRVAILDIDCHHGNGTEDIFHGHSSVQYVSLHQSPLYPGTGRMSRENCLNFPLAPMTGPEGFMKALDTACEAIEKFNPSLLGISAGFDTFENDPITDLSMTVESYERVGQRIADLNRPMYIVMEGGYSRELPLCVEKFLAGIT